MAITCAALGGCMVIASPAGAAPSDSLHINEILHNPEGTDGPNEYVEIKGTPGATIPANTYLVFIESDSSGLGDVQNIFNLSGLTLGANGFLVLLQNASPYTAIVSPQATVVTGTGTGFTGAAGFAADTGTDIENESYTALLISAATAPTLTMDIDANNDGTADGANYSSWTILDGVATTDAVTDLPYAVANFDDGEWLGRPTGDPSGMTSADWVGSPLDNGATLPPTLALGVATVPSSYAGDLLDHIGSPNFPAAPEPVIPEMPWAVLAPLSAGFVAALTIGARRRAARA